MAQLLNLPAETLQEIFEHIALDYRPLADLKALCHTCKAICNIAQPMIYRHFIFNRKENWSEKEVGHKLLRFADTLARRPELRKSVKELQLDLEADDDLAENTGCFVSPDFDLGGLRSAAPQYFSSNKKRGMWGENKTIQVFPHVEAILSILPRLELLRLRVGARYGLRNPSLGFGPESAQYLANVKELVLCGPTGFNSEPAKFDMIMRLIVSLPQLKKLHLKNFDIAGIFRKQEDRESAQWHVTEGTMGIEDLCIRSCPMTNEILQRIIRSCRRLVKFNFKTWSDIDYEKRRRFWRKELDVEALHAVLSLHKASLEELSLNCINVFEKMNDYSPVQRLPAYPSFLGFSRVKMLKIEYRRMRYEHLPPNITHLYLCDCRDVQDDAEVEAWKAIKRTSCPDIEKVEIMCTDQCRAIQYQLKYMHFQWGCWTEHTREWYKDGFELKVWFKDFIDGTYHFSQANDTGDIDSNGEKIRDDDEEEEEEEDEDEDGDEGDGGDGEDMDESRDNDNIGVNDDETSPSHQQRATSNEPRVEDANDADSPQNDDQIRPRSPISTAESSHTFDWVDDLLSDFDEMDMDIDDAHSIPSNGTFEWVNELISEAEDDEEEDYPPKAVDMRAVLLAGEDQDDGWRGGEWRAPKKVGFAQGKGKGRKEWGVLGRRTDCEDSVE
ncbi:F-box domain protein [Paraphaeosphaeria sporulosa]